MPARIESGDTALSFAYAINKSQDFFRINRDDVGNRTDGFLKAAGKAVTRVPVNVALTTLAAIETVVKAFLTAASLLLYPITAAPFNYLKDATALAGRATKEAFIGILGFSTPVLKEVKATMEKEAVVVTVEPAPTPLVNTTETEETEETEEEEIIEPTKTQAFLDIATDYKVATVIALAVIAYHTIGPVARGTLLTGCETAGNVLSTLGTLSRGYLTVGNGTFAAKLAAKICG